MWTSAELKIRAKGAFYKNYWLSVLVGIVMAVFSGAMTLDVLDYFGRFYYFPGSDTVLTRVIESILNNVYLYGHLRTMAGLSGILMILVKVFLGNPMYVGGCRFFIRNQTMNPTLGEFRTAFTPQAYKNIVVTMFLKNLYISLWTLLFIIPGIIKRYEYLMIPYILAENPQMSREEAFLISKRMMDGQKLNAFALDLTFIGWAFVELFTFGTAGVFYVEPYYQATLAELYAVNRTMAYQSGYIR